MGAQAAALLGGQPPYGDVPPVGPDDGGLRLRLPPRWSSDVTLDLLARSTAGVALRPSAYDGHRLHRVLDAGRPVAVRVDAALAVTWTGPEPDRAAVRRQLTMVLGLDDHLGTLWEACARVPALAWVSETGAGRVLRAPTVLEDLLGLLSATGSSLRSSRARVAALV
ncbi:MAG: hypothetical protein M3P93_14870, partial [Actinomycetota bacterium]|nr:hypothetical protein [Actinomycetota bacterium]